MIPERERKAEEFRQWKKDLDARAPEMIPVAAAPPSEEQKQPDLPVFRLIGIIGNKPLFTLEPPTGRPDSIGE
jgi:hypothetical protein